MAKKIFESSKIKIVFLEEDTIRTSPVSLGEDTGDWMEEWGGNA